MFLASCAACRAAVRSSAAAVVAGPSSAGGPPSTRFLSPSPPAAGLAIGAAAHFSQSARRWSNEAEQKNAAAGPSSRSGSSGPSMVVDAGPRRPPPLPRPLGVVEPPFNPKVKPTIKQRAEKLLDTDARMQERRHLVKEASTGYFEDYNKLRHEGGKLWIAPKTLIIEKAARYFPDIEGTRLAPAPGTSETSTRTSQLLRGKISVVAMLSTRISEAHIETYTKTLLPVHKDDPDFQFVQINLQDNKLKWGLLSLFLGSLRRSVPEAYRSTYLVSTQSMEYLKEPMGMTNKHPGYVYLVDENCKIRWAAVSSAQVSPSPDAADAPVSDAPAPVDEVVSLANCVEVLLQRLRGEDQQT